MLGIIETVSVIVLFILCIISYKKIKDQQEELLRVYEELGNSNRLLEEIKIKEEVNSSFFMVNYS